MNSGSGNDVEKKEVLRMATEIIASYVSRNQTPSAELPELINTVFESLNNISSPSQLIENKQKPAVAIRRSITPDFIICLEDGQKLKMLKRYLRTNYSMTPEEYRTKWNLPHDYPMVSPNYAKKRSEFAKNIGLGKSGKKSSSK